MAIVQITLTMDAEAADEHHGSGVTEVAYQEIIDFLGSYGYDITITKVGDEE